MWLLTLNIMFVRFTYVVVYNYSSFIMVDHGSQELPRCLTDKESAFQCRRHGFDPWARKISWRRKWQPTPVSLPAKSHGQSSLAGHPAYLTYMQNTSCKMPGWMNYKLESRLLGEMSTTSDMQMINTTLIAESEEKPKSLLMRVKKPSKTQHSKN